MITVCQFEKSNQVLQNNKSYYKSISFYFFYTTGEQNKAFIDIQNFSLLHTNSLKKLVKTWCICIYDIFKTFENVSKL